MAMSVHPCLTLVAMHSRYYDEVKLEVRVSSFNELDTRFHLGGESLRYIRGCSPCM